MEKITIRMWRSGLEGYVFQNEQHARDWLNQKFRPEANSETSLQRVRLKKEAESCPHCKGSGWKEPKLEIIESMTVAEFLEEKK